MLGRYFFHRSRYGRVYAAAGPGRAHQNHRHRRCGGCRRDRRARASCEAGPGCGARGRRVLAGHTRTTGTAGVEGAGGSCRRAGGRWRGLAGLRDDAPSEARGADGSRAGHRPPAHTAAGPSGARNTSGAAATDTDTDTTKRAGTSRFRPAPDARAWAISSERPPCHPCRSSRR